jgi:hypothetical protein
MTPTISGRFKRSGQVSRLRPSRQANPREPKLTILIPVEAVTKSRSLAALTAFLAVLCVCRADAGQAPRQARQKIEVAKLGPQVGQSVPDFNLRDQTGRMRNLQSVMGSRGAMLVFFRSADW